MDRRPLALSVLLAALTLASSAPAGAETIYVRADGGSLVFSNTPDDLARPFFEDVSGGFRRPMRVVEPPPAYGRFLDEAARANGLPASLVKAVALVESGYNARALSPKGARGVMQLMPATARQHGVRDAFDPYQNIHGGAKHLRMLMDEFRNDERLAIAAYNAGSGAVRRYNGVPNYRETKEYVRRVSDARARFDGAQRAGGTTSAATLEIAPDAPAGDPVHLMRSADGTLVLSN